MAISDNDRHDAYLRRMGPPVVDVETIATMLRRRAAFIAAVTLVCAGLSVVYIMVAPARYIATGRILLDSAGEIESQMKAIASPDMLDKVIGREKLESDPLFGARPRGILTSLLASAGLVPPADPHATALRQLTRTVSVTREPGSSVVIVDARTSNRDTSAQIVNSVMEVYVQDASRARPDVMPRTELSADAALDKLQARLRSAEQALQNYRQDNPVTQEASGSAITELSNQLSAAEGKLSSSRATLMKVQRAKDDRDLTVIPEALRTETFHTLRARYIAANRNETSLTETLGSRHPRVKQAEQQTAEASRLLDRALGDMVQSASTEVESARSTVTRLKARLESSKSAATVSRDTSGHLKELERNVELSRTAYQAMLSRSRASQTRQQTYDAGPRIEVRATPPLERSGAAPFRVLLVSLILGLGLALSLAWLFDLMEQRKVKDLLR